MSAATEAVIIDSVRTPIGRALKGSLRELRPDETTAFIMDALLDRNPGVDLGVWSRRSTSAAGSCPRDCRPTTSRGSRCCSPSACSKETTALVTRSAATAPRRWSRSGSPPTRSPRGRAMSTSPAESSPSPATTSRPRPRETPGPQRAPPGRQPRRALGRLHRDGAHRRERRRQAIRRHAGGTGCVRQAKNSQDRAVSPHSRTASSTARSSRSPSPAEKKKKKKKKKRKGRRRSGQGRRPAPRHDAGEARRAQARLPRGRHRDRRQRLPAKRWRGGHADHECRQSGPSGWASRPRARIITAATAGNEPELMGVAPIGAIRQGSSICAGMTIADVDVVEMNEASPRRCCRMASGDHGGSSTRSAARSRLATVREDRRPDHGDAAQRSGALRRAPRDRDDVRRRRHGAGDADREVVSQRNSLTASDLRWRCRAAWPCAGFASGRLGADPVNWNALGGCRLRASVVVGIVSGSGRTLARFGRPRGGARRGVGRG